jgi:phytanoyl-CoA hydroxylase
MLRDDFRRDGFVIAPVLTGDEVDALLEEAAAICAGARGPVRGVSPAPDGADRDAVLGRYLCVHFPHKASPHVRAALAHPHITDTLGEVIGPNVKCMQSMLFVKASGKPGQAWHQDEFYIPTRDRSLTGVWLALDDATIENGCLWVLPGSHRHGVLWAMHPHGSADFDEGHEAFGTPYDGEPGVACEIPRGHAIFFNGYLLHRSLPNRAPRGRFRRALVNHYMSAESMLPWDWDGRIAPTRDMRDIVLVRGEDPYAWKGTQEITYPYLRAERDSQDDPNRDPGKRVF